LKPKRDKPPSSFAFIFDERRYSEVDVDDFCHACVTDANAGYSAGQEHLSTFQLNLNAFCGTGGVFGGI
jgi:hypothetical protein